MPDIAMCKNVLCPMCETCYRFRATPDPYYQSYFLGEVNEDNKCGYYWPVVSKSEIRILDIQHDL